MQKTLHTIRWIGVKRKINRHQQRLRKKKPWEITRTHLYFFCLCVWQRDLIKQYEVGRKFLKNVCQFVIISGRQTDLVFVYKTINVCQLFTEHSCLLTPSAIAQRSEFLSKMFRFHCLLSRRLSQPKSHYFHVFFAVIYTNEFYTFLNGESFCINFTLWLIKGLRRRRRKPSKIDRFLKKFAMQAKQ